jgi:hypothetical protein
MPKRKRAGLGLLGQAGPTPEAWVAIIDHSIDIGTKKVLAVLRMRATALEEKGSALALADCQCIGLEVGERTDGETVAGHLIRAAWRRGHACPD